MVLELSSKSSFKYLVALFFILSFMVFYIYPFVSGVTLDRVDVNLYIVDAEPLFIKYGNLYVINDKLCINCQDPVKIVLVDNIIRDTLDPINDWPRKGHPFLKGLRLDSEIGPYKSGYFKDKIVLGVNRLLESSGLKGIRVLIQGNVVIIISKSFSQRHFNSQFLKEIGKIYLDNVAEMIAALNKEGFNIDINSFLYGLKSRVNVVFIKSPFNPYVTSHLTEKIVSAFESSSNEVVFDRYKFVVKGIGVSTYLGSYYAIIPLSCKLREVNINYSYSSIEDVLPYIEKFGFDLFGYEYPLIVVPISNCNELIDLQSYNGTSNYTGSEFYLKELDVSFIKSEPILLNEVLSNYPLGASHTITSESSKPNYGELFFKMLILALALCITYVVIRRYLLKKI